MSKVRVHYTIEGSVLVDRSVYPEGATLEEIAALEARNEDMYAVLDVCDVVSLEVNVREGDDD